MPVDRRRILFDDDHLLAVNKLSSELVVGGRGGKSDVLPLLDFLRKDYPGLRPVHRLDFETSGVVLFARTRSALERAMEMKMQKVYRSLVAGRMEHDRGEIRIPLPARSGRGTIPAMTTYRVLARLGQCTLVEAQIQTGRQHQIRKHMAAIGHPLLLDDVYGDKTFNHRFAQKYHYHRFFLHATELSFAHPFTGKNVTIEAPMPRIFKECLEKVEQTTTSRRTPLRLRAPQSDR